ncbi:GNAT family N-acetyltransferase [Flexibacterium corallicola]|uniref:GNAT family N-acetyltransferase n=1 Tax=Flexibacterium corallicola TaxID=3037259 RepID=UPI00286F0342|nr:GNAT family N-acetyltransferase [Pseudovibrio sp. M1P-2-3]
MTNTTQNQITLRPLVPEDYQQAITLYNEFKGPPILLEGEAAKEHFAKIVEHSDTTIFGAQLGERVVSMATLHVLPNMTWGGRPYCLIENVITLEAFQGRGIGSKTMEHLIKAAWEAGAYKIMLLTGKENTAYQFYGKFGFSQDQKRGMMLRRVPSRHEIGA